VLTPSVKGINLSSVLLLFFSFPRWTEEEDEAIDRDIFVFRTYFLVVSVCGVSRCGSAAVMWGGGGGGTKG